MSPRLAQVLKELNVEIEHFATVTEGEALRRYPIGQKTLKEIAILLTEKNLKFKGDSIWLKSYYSSLEKK